MRHVLAGILVVCLIASVSAGDDPFTYDHGGITRADKSKKQLALVFTAGEFGEGVPHILGVCEKQKLEAAFFVTGDFLRNPAHDGFARKIVAAGHYLGPHSDAHPLYCPWDDREKSLITEQQFSADLLKNISDLRSHGALKPDAPLLFIPPYEWFNRDQVAWSKSLGVQLINFTPGSGSNRDYMPESEKKFVSSQKILDDILAYEQKDPHGLNGFILLLHAGADRQDKMYLKLEPLIVELKNRGYDFVRIDQLLTSWRGHLSPASQSASIATERGRDAPATKEANLTVIRANQVGYLPGDPKIAVLSSSEPLSGKFSVGDFSADIGADQGTWGPFRHNYRLDFSQLREPGRYAIRFGAVESHPFRIGDDAYDQVPGKLMDFMKLQRCGDNPVTGKKCHQHDAIDATTGKPVDLIGGWHDAADRIKHNITTSYCVAALWLAGANEEARYGGQYLRKIHPDADTIYLQVADDRDHSPPAKLWHEDQTDYGHGAGGARSAWRASGKPDGPKHQNRSTGCANLAGRSAAAMMLLGDLETAKSLYALGKRHPGVAQSVPVKAPYYYGEASWTDDMAWAATELFIATRDQSYLADAIDYARQAGMSPWMGNDRHGHYECFPYVYLSHWRLYPHVDDSVKQELAGFYKRGLERVRDRAMKNPYRLGTPLVWCSTNDVIAFATQAKLYEQMTGDTQFNELATEARDWIFGRNPWGVSFVIGVPESGNPSMHPHHLFYKLANHLPVGGLVDGPVYKDINDSLKFGDFGTDKYAQFQSIDGGVFHDVFEDFSTNEPIIDGTVSLLFLLKHWNR